MFMIFISVDEDIIYKKKEHILKIGHIMLHKAAIIFKYKKVKSHFSCTSW